MSTTASLWMSTSGGPMWVLPVCTVTPPLTLTAAAVGG
jgi:hypothetical protein